MTTDGVEIRWVTALGVDPTSAASIPWQCNDLIYAIGSSGVAVARFSLGGPARLTLPASRSVRQGTLVGGLAPEGAVRVVIVTGRGTRDAVLLEPSSGSSVGRPGQPVFGQWFPGARSPGSTTTITAYDAAGAVLDRRTY